MSNFKKLMIGIALVFFTGISFFLVDSYQKMQIEKEKAIKLQNLQAKGEDELKKQKTKEAAETANSILKEYPDDIRGLLIRAEAALIFEQLGQAEADYLKVIKLDEKNYTATSRLGAFYFYMNKFDLALNFLKKAKDINPKDQENLKFLAQTYSKLGRSLEAIQEFKDILEMNKYDGDTYIHIGNEYHNQKNYEKAIEYFTKGIEIQGDAAGFAYFKRARSYMDAENFEKAILDVEKMIKLEITDDEATATLHRIAILCYENIDKKKYHDRILMHKFNNEMLTNDVLRELYGKKQGK